MNRRTFIKSSSIIATTGIITGIYTWKIEPFWPEVVQRKMAINHLPTDLKGKTLMQISDIHVGNRFDYRFIIESMQKVADLKPDYVVYTGDYVSWENQKQLSQLEEVMQYAVKGDLGTAAILGNHDYGHGWNEPVVAHDITDILTQSGICSP